MLHLAPSDSPRATDVDRALVPPCRLRPATMIPRLPDPAPIRHEAHFDDRVMRCFRDRPADTWALFEKAIATHPQADALVA